MNKPLDVKLRARAFCSLEPFGPTAPTKKKIFSASLTCILSVLFMMTSVLDVFISLVFQFEDVSLNTCLWLLERGQLGTAARANPVRVTRCISAMVRVSQLMGWLTWISKEVQFMYFWKSNEFHWSKFVGKLQWSRWWCSFRSLGQRLSQRHDCSNSMVRQCRHSGKILAEEDCCQVCSVLGLFRARYNMYVLFST